MPVNISTSKMYMGFVIVLLFIYAYKNFYKCKSIDEEEEGGIFSNLKKTPKKVDIVEPSESGKEKISRLVEGILKRQLPE